MLHSFTAKNLPHTSPQFDTLPLASQSQIAGKTWSRLFLILPGLLYLAVSVPHLNLVPMWDGLWYADCFPTASLSDFSRPCFGHPSQGWLVFLRLSQLLFPGSANALNAVQVLFGLTAVVAFQATIAALWPAARHTTLNLLISIAFALNPVVVGNMLNASPDNGVLEFYLCFVACLLRGRYRSAALSGLFLLFSKEPGIGYYLVTIATLACVVFTQPQYAISRGPALRRAWVLALPLLAFVGVFLEKVSAAKRSMWVGMDDYSNFAEQLSPLVDLPKVLRLLAIVVVQNFAWVTSGLILAGATIKIRDAARKRPKISVLLMNRMSVLIFLLLVFLYISTRFVLEHPSPRYVMICVPVALLAVRKSLDIASAQYLARFAAVTLIVLNAGSLYFSADPVSRLLFGTFSVGRSAMYRPLPGPLPGGVSEGQYRDELIYNLQFTKFDKLFNEVLAQYCRSDCQIVTAFNRWRGDYGMNVGGLSRRALPNASEPALCLAREDVRRKFLSAGYPLDNPHPCLIFVGMPNAPGAIYAWSKMMEDSFHDYHLAFESTLDVDGFTAKILQFLPRSEP